MWKYHYSKTSSTIHMIQVITRCNKLSCCKTEKKKHLKHTGLTSMDWLHCGGLFKWCVFFSPQNRQLSLRANRWAVNKYRWSLSRNLYFMSCLLHPLPRCPPSPKLSGDISVIVNLSDTENLSAAFFSERLSGKRLSPMVCTFYGFLIWKWLL